MTEPVTGQELAEALASAAALGRTVALGGNFSKKAAGGGEVVISTRRLTRVLEYEPRDLTVSVEAGIPFAELSRLLAARGQMIPLDPPWTDEATIGGVLAMNQSGPRRRLYGTARDMVIGMTFATLEGKLVQSGGMVVKNVAGLDMAKLLIGSFGTLAAIASVNFKVHPIPEGTRTFARRFAQAGDAIAARNGILRSVLQPAAVDIEKASDGYTLLLQAGGNRAVLERYGRELAGFDVVEGAEESALWRRIREMAASFMKANPEGGVRSFACPLSEVGKVLERMPGAALARAGNGVVYGFFRRASDAADMRAEIGREMTGRDDFLTMEKIKLMFDPGRLLNRGGLHGCI